jgi:hypothetical protein
MFAGKKVHDPCGNVTDMKTELAKNLQKLSTGHPGKVRVENMNTMYLSPGYIQQFANCGLAIFFSIMAA